MANLLTSGLAYNPYFYVQEALTVLYKRLGMAFYVKRDLAEGKASGTGDTIQVRRPQAFTTAAMPIAEASFADVSPHYDNLVISEWRGQGFKLTDKETTLTPDVFVRDHITPVAASIADKIDQDLSSLALEVPWIVEDDATTPTNDFAAMRKTLFDNKAPLVNPIEYAYMTDGVLQERYEKSTTFVQANTAGDQSLQRDVQLGVKFGFRIFPNQNAPTAAAGTLSTTTLLTNGAFTKGATSVNLDAATLTGIIRRGNVLTITGDTQKYAVKADVTASGNALASVTISPPLAADVADGVTVTVDQTASTSTGIAFHRDAFALVMQPLSPAGPGILTATVQDPITGLTLRSRVWGSGGLGATIWALDALWGTKTLNPNLAVRLRI